MELIDRKRAAESGLTMYFTGMPCPHGHIAPRHVSSKSCSECAKANGKRHYQNNRDTYLSRVKAAHAANPEPARRRAKAWRSANLLRARRREAGHRQRKRVQLAIYLKLWRLANLDRSRALGRAKESARRARKRSAAGAYTADDVARLWKLQRGRCACCGQKLGKQYHADHIEPLRRGGSNHRTNIQLTCPPCNLSKGARDPIEHAQVKLGRLL